jgi:hypothetical protein
MSALRAHIIGHTAMEQKRYGLLAVASPLGDSAPMPEGGARPGCAGRGGGTVRAKVRSRVVPSVGSRPVAPPLPALYRGKRQ